MTGGDAPRAGDPVRAPIFDGAPGDEVARELDFHLEMRAREYRSRGMSDAEARRRAEAHFPDLHGVRRAMHDLADRRGKRERRSRFFADMMEDLHFTARMLWRRRGVAALAILTMALGIGAATAIYSVVDHVMLRPLSFAKPEQLVAVWLTDQGFRDNIVTASWWDHVVLGNEEYRALQDGANSIRDVALFQPGAAMLATGNGPVRVTRLTVTANLLNTLRVRPILGRGFSPLEDVLDGPPVALLSAEVWQQQFGGDSGIVGRTVRLGADDYTVVGVVPPGIRLDRTQPATAVWVPALQDSFDIVSRHNRGYRAIARLAPGVTAAQASDEVGRVLQRTETRNPEHIGATVQPWQDDQTRNVRGSLWILFGAGGLLLLIACVNVAVLLLGEATRRRQEMASRAAIGASPWRLVRQLLTESVAIALLGAIGGTVVAWGAIKMMVAKAPVVIPGLDEVRLDTRALAFAIACALITGVLFGVGPALTMLRRGGTMLRLGLGQSARHANRVQHTLIALEIALSLVLVAGCLMLTRSLRLLASVEPGFHAEELTVVLLNQQRWFSDDEPRALAFFPMVAAELSTLPGVQAASLTGNVPFAAGGTNSPVRVEGVEYAEGENGPRSEQRPAVPGYFATMQIPLRAGRDFAASDVAGSEPVIIVSEAGARRDWPGVSPIGKRLFWQGKWRTVIGMVGDIQYQRLSDEIQPFVYVPLSQYNGGNLGFVVRGPLSPALAQAIRDRLKALDPAITVAAIKPMTELMAKSYAEQQYRTTLASIFGALAGVLAVVGIYGVIARAVTQRAREAGIRVALGATGASVSRLMIRDAMGAVLIGLVIGFPMALYTGHLLAPYLFQVTAQDPVSFGLALLLLLGAGLIAAFPPARRAGRVDPVVVLRGE